MIKLKRRPTAVSLWMAAGAIFSAALSNLALAEVGLVNRQGAVISIHDLHFFDEAGKAVSLDSFFNSKTPVVLALVYYECPGVCTAVLNQLFSELKRSGFTPGRAFEAVVVSIDPNETSLLAAKKKKTYFREYGFLDDSAGFHFLTGESSQISKLASDLGFQYERTKDARLFLHPSALFFLSPEGVLVQTSATGQMTSRGFRASLAQASHQGISTFFNRMIIACAQVLPQNSWFDSFRFWLNRFRIR